MLLSRRPFISYLNVSKRGGGIRRVWYRATPLNSYSSMDDDEEPSQNLEPGVKERMVSNFNSSFNVVPKTTTKEAFASLILDKWNRRHEITFYIKNKQLCLCILESIAGDQDYMERIADVVDIINEYNLSVKIERFIRFHPRKYVPANGIEIPLGIYYTGDKANPLG